jgi:predicted aspartyl protease
MPVWWQVDTGGALSVIGQAAARQLGLSIEQGGTHIYGVNGKDITAHTRLPELKLGNLASRNEVFPVTSYGGDGTDERPIGLFGADYLQNYDVEIDMDHGKFNLFSTDHCKGKVVYWASQYSAAPFHLSDQRMIELDATLDGQTMIADIDTGASVTFISKGAARRYFGLDENSQGLAEAGKSRGLDGSVDIVYKYPFKTLVLAGLKIHNPIVLIMPFAVIKDYASAEHIKPNASSDMLVGMDVISKLHSYIAYREDMFYYTVASPPKTAAVQ